MLNRTAQFQLPAHDIGARAQIAREQIGASELIEDALRVAKESSKRLTVAAVADSAASPFSEGELTF